MMTGLRNPGPLEFDAVLESEGVGSYVEVPVNLKDTYGKGNMVPVQATFDHNVNYRGSLASMSGKAVLGIRKELREQIGKEIGDRLHVRIELDEAPRVIELPADVNALVRGNSAALHTWERLSYSHQREFQEWIEAARKPETRQRRVESMLERLQAGKSLK